MTITRKRSRVELQNPAPEPHDELHSVLDYALAYAAAGFAVFPCEFGGKAPLTNRGFKDANDSISQIYRWFVSATPCNIAIATGDVSNLVVLDFDPRNGADCNKFLTDNARYFAGVKYGRVLTGGGGTHLFFRKATPLFRPPAELFGPGVDVKCDGGYVIAPPSIHPSGGQYVWCA